MQLDGLGFRYHLRSPWVLHDIAATIEPGDVVAVSGRNGAGKSTLLRLLAGVMRPSRGSVTGRPAAVGYAPERFPVRQPFSVRAYLAGATRVRGLPSEALDRAIERWCAALGLSGTVDLPLRDLSKGTAQKVGLVQALLASASTESSLLVLDEPWSGLDEAARRYLPTLVGELRAAGASIVLTDHEGRTGDVMPSQRWSVGRGSVQVTRPAGTTRPAATSVVVRVRLPAVDASGFVDEARLRGYDAAVDTAAEEPR